MNYNTLEQNIHTVKVLLSSIVTSAVHLCIVTSLLHFCKDNKNYTISYTVILFLFAFSNIESLHNKNKFYFDLR